MNASQSSAHESGTRGVAKAKTSTTHAVVCYHLLLCVLT